MPWRNWYWIRQRLIYFGSNVVLKSPPPQFFCPIYPLTNMRKLIFFLFLHNFIPLRIWKLRLLEMNINVLLGKYTLPAQGFLNSSSWLRAHVSDSWFWWKETWPSDTQKHYYKAAPHTAYSTWSENIGNVSFNVFKQHVLQVIFVGHCRWLSPTLKVPCIASDWKRMLANSA